MWKEIRDRWQGECESILLYVIYCLQFQSLKKTQIFSLITLDYQFAFV